ncbi:MAG: N-acetylmuramoyl-L-alanine amidase [Gemmatimonadaceae bacterium]
MITTRFAIPYILAASVAAAACAAPRVASAPIPEAGTAATTPPLPAVVMKAPLPEPNPALPPVPELDGPLAIKVVYPPADHLIQSKDSNFIFGNLGTGKAGLTINGVLAPVWPNGAFMAFLPNPPHTAARYDIVATTGTDTVRLSHPVKIAPPAVAPAEPVTPVPTPDTMVTISPAKYADLIGPAAYASDTDRVITAYAPTGGIQRWFLLPDTRVRVVGTKGTSAYVMLGSLQTVRVDKADLKMLDSVSSSPALKAAAFRIQNFAQWTDIIIPINDRPAYLVEETGDSLTLILYETAGPVRAQTARPGATAYVSSVMAKRAGTQMRYRIDLRGAIYGYQPLWEKGKLTFRVRKPPRIDSASPLAGLTIAIDPGHPPIGATGPTGLWEPVPTLDVGFKVRELLQAKGVTVFMTRESAEPVDLNLRPTLARRVNANALVSIHLNAFPDGVNPFEKNGTATYHYHLHSGPLAQAVQAGAVAHLGLRDNGVKRENFALVRPTWMPAVLVEGAFIILPDQEAALRTPEYQEKYAQGIVDGLEDYFRSLAPIKR